MPIRAFQTFNFFFVQPRKNIESFVTRIGQFSIELNQNQNQSYVPRNREGSYCTTHNAIDAIEQGRTLSERAAPFVCGRAG
jgi:hypothetical protein